MIQVICDFCGRKVMKEFVHKVKIEPWYDPKMVGHVYRRDFDCCEECAKAIEHRLIMIENNWLWHGKDPNRRYKNWELKDRKEQPKIGHCKNCKYFEYDSVAKVDGIPLIVAHEICNKWGDGYKTKEDGYCFLFEPKAESEAQE